MSKKKTSFYYVKLVTNIFIQNYAQILFLISIDLTFQHCIFENSFFISLVSI